MTERLLCILCVLVRIPPFSSLHTAGSSAPHAFYVCIDSLSRRLIDQYGDHVACTVICFEVQRCTCKVELQGCPGVKVLGPHEKRDPRPKFTGKWDPDPYIW